MTSSHKASFISINFDHFMINICRIYHNLHEPIGKIMLTCVCATHFHAYKFYFINIVNKSGGLGATTTFVMYRAQLHAHRPYSDTLTVGVSVYKIHSSATYDANMTIG